jgi:hypothetical protein
MLDVHPPHEAAHSWREFFVHMATICLGLLIAIGLEQSVEWVHHRDELKELRETLRRDAEGQIGDCKDVEAATTVLGDSLSRRIEQVSLALQTHQPLKVVGSAKKPHDFNVPEEPAWNAAKASGLLTLMPQGDVAAYSEADSCLQEVTDRYEKQFTARRKLRDLETKMTLMANDPDFSKATPEDLKVYLAMLIDTRSAVGDFRYWCRQVRGADVAILRGELDVKKIEASERQFND